MIAKLLAWVLKRTTSEKGRHLLLTAISEGIGTVPIRAAIATDAGNRVLIHGKLPDPEQMLSIREGASAALKNKAENLVEEQLRFMAINQGYLANLDPTKDAVFYKAALWWEQERRNLLRGLAGEL